MPENMDVHRFIEVVKAHPVIWDIRYGEYKDRTTTPQQWAEISGTMGVDVEQCKRKWKNLRDAYRAEVRRLERRKELQKASGTYDSSTEIRSKWAYFDAMSFINDSRRPSHNIYKIDAEGEGGDASNESHDTDEPPGFHSICDIKLEPYHMMSDEDDFEDDRLLEEFVNAATPQAVRRLSNSISEANAVEDAAMADIAAPSSNIGTTTTTASGGINCKCSKRADDQMHFLETLEREEQSLMQSTRMDMRRDNSIGHVGDSDYNFLVSFLPKMKRMSELQNLQFRAKMSELLLNILAPQTSVVPMQPTTAATITGVQQQQPRSLKHSAIPAIQLQKSSLIQGPVSSSDLMKSIIDLEESEVSLN
ncbi:uncharacterized protein hng3 isoform X2 [Eurosta solidaginis]|uniref:uncharacterized protein hng3 isoform X2 n=1 Tax=Eurosta solidaginis TaxID=178769 RepID=UPI0035311E9F